MNGLWLERQTLSYRQRIPRPSPGPGEALVRVRLAGICATDLELTRGYSPFTGVPGHEFVGEVVDAPDAPDRVGQRVVGEINAVCGDCPSCRSGLARHCEQRTVLGIVGRHGAFAEFLTLPLANLHPVPEDLADETAVFCEPLAAALQMLEQVAVHPSHQVVVIGAGRLGQLVAQILATTGCGLIVVARHANQRLALEKRGIVAAGVDEIRADGSIRADRVVEASGSPAGFELAMDLVRPRGTIVLKSTYHGRLTTSLTRVVVNELTIVGSRCGPFAPALRLLQHPELVDPTALIEGRYPFSAGLQAFEHAARPGALKILLVDSRSGPSPP